MAWAGCAGLAQGSRDRGRANPAIAVPARATALDAETVDHSIAEEPLVALRIGGDWVWADAQISPIEGRRDRASYGQIFDGDFFNHRRVNAGEERMWTIWSAHVPAVEGRERGRTLGHNTANRSFDNVCHNDHPPGVYPAVPAT